MLYEVEIKRIDEAAQNNPNKFPDRFSWILTENESIDEYLESLTEEVSIRRVF